LVARGTLPVMSGGHGQDDYATAADVAENCWGGITEQPPHHSAGLIALHASRSRGSQDQCTQMEITTENCPASGEFLLREDRAEKVFGADQGDQG
jgi:hypothetical protein